MSRRRNTRVESATVVRRPRATFVPYAYEGTESYAGHVITPSGIVLAMSDAINDLCRYDVVAGGKQYIYYEDGQRTKRGLARRASELARDAMVRAGAFRRKG